MSLEWSHCSEYAQLQDAIVHFREAQVAFDAAGETLEGADETYREVLAGQDPVRTADARAVRDDARETVNAANRDLSDALEDLAVAELVAAAAARAIVADVSLDDDARYAAQAAVEAYTAASDAAGYVASGEMALSLDTETYRSAFEAAEAAAWATAEDSRATADRLLTATHGRLAAAEAAAATTADAVASAEDYVRENQETAYECC